MRDTQTLRRTVRLPVRSPISPADAEAALLDNYRDLVRLAYAMLPPKQGHQRRVLAAHAVVQRALPDDRRLERHLRAATDATAFARDRVLQEAHRQAAARTPVRLLPATWFYKNQSAGDPCSLKPAARKDLVRRNARGRNVAIAMTCLLTLGILASLITYS